MATVRRIVDGDTKYGPAFLFKSGDGTLHNYLSKAQFGDLYLAAASGTVASGAFDEEFDNAPFATFTPTADPSGRFYISEVTTTHLYVTFTTTPAGAEKTFPYKVGNWMAIL
jgi:hypothetical protein